MLNAMACNRAHCEHLEMIDCFARTGAFLLRFGLLIRKDDPFSLQKRDYWEILHSLRPKISEDAPSEESDMKRLAER